MTGNRTDDSQASSSTGSYTALPADLPIPEDDGAANHLVGMKVPSLLLPSTDGGTREGGQAKGGTADLAEMARGWLVAYVYPRTGVPGKPLPAGWDDIPGARGCTPQSCAFRDTMEEFSRAGAAVAGVSAQSPEEQREFSTREHIPFPLLSDAGLELARVLRLPTFEAAGMTLYKRLTFIAEEGRIVKTFYPVFPPDRNATEVLAWLQQR
jgi:peroxiredoxin